MPAPKAVTPNGCRVRAIGPTRRAGRRDCRIPTEHIEIHGTGTVRVPPGAYPISNLQIGKNCGDHSRVEVDGGKIVLLQDPLDVGDVTGSEGELILKDGALHNCVDTYVGGGMGVAGRATRGAFIVQGGSYLGRTLVLGTGWGAQSFLGIEGSRPSAIHILQYFYVTAHVGSDGAPGTATLSFTLDEHGVTPITIQSTHDGLRIMQGHQKPLPPPTRAQNDSAARRYHAGFDARPD